MLLMLKETAIVNTGKRFASLKLFRLSVVSDSEGRKYDIPLEDSSAPIYNKASLGPRSPQRELHAKYHQQ
jgi:hypothetical protein